jgi:hypothetical protein
MTEFETSMQALKEYARPRLGDTPTLEMLEWLQDSKEAGTLETHVLKHFHTVMNNFGRLLG